MEYQVQNISTNNFEQCIKCTICTVYCPLLAVNPDYPGPKQAGPDGERYRLKNQAFYDKALKYCLNCKRCEVACPSNVRIGDIIQSARLRYDRSPIKLRDRLLANTDFVGRLATTVAPVTNFMLRRRVVKSAMSTVLDIDRHRRMPAYASRTFEAQYRSLAAGQDAFKQHVAYFHGCYVNYNKPDLGLDLLRVLNACGYGVRLLDKERCCGVAKIANRLADSARRDAVHNVAAIRRATADSDMPVLFTGSTCVFTMRDEYPHVLGVDNADIRSKLLLATLWLSGKVERGEIKLVFHQDYRKRITYHTACHIQKLGWAIYSINLLKLIPGVDFVPLESQCCGIAGTYGFKKENYDTAQAIGSELFAKLRRIAPDVVACDCETCKWQIEMSTGLTVENPISIIAEALDYEATARANSIHQP
ncbi:MAG: anaerobic glycerol-3-phosphate dehydrogenase subunit GlpC [Muribaculaceae bacterium]|nr:anaerobic glycerol-3-phosphate dehydrogenase subunit GlpC [Muribaculaceae bacterium]